MPLRQAGLRHLVREFGKPIVMSEPSEMPSTAQHGPLHDPPHHVELAADIVSAYVSNNSVPATDLPSLIDEIHSALLSASGPAKAVVEPPRPAVPAKKSITDEFIFCLEDGRKFKSLKRHLRTKYDLSPEQYREKWGLAPDYPMVAPSYAKARSTLAKEMGLGQQRKRHG